MTQIIERPSWADDKEPDKPRSAPAASPPVATVSMAQAINRALHDAMASDDRVLVFGEDVARLGGVFRVTDGLLDNFGAARCFDTPLAESSIVGIAIGMAIRGMVPVPEIQFDGFAAPAFDQIVSHLAKYRMRTRGDIDMPVTIRIPSFGGIGAVEHHSESTESYWLHTAGLKVVVPSTPSDAYWLLREAISSRDPVIFLEPKRRYWTKGELDTTTAGPPIGRAVVRRIGRDVTVITYGSLVDTALAAAEHADDHDLEVIDLRSLNPLDFDTIATSVRKTGRAVVMHEGPRTLGFGAELAARISEDLFYDLEAPVLRATGFDTPYPPARLEKLWLPGVDRLLDCVRKAMSQP
ncbi:alpha-ketoacid dehydrogenase subunit beta [Mycobacterium sp. CBMA293]|uniref:alpha-ketoacid dehydrogenase subunit beta n=1 Tax=unclassified Mycolicibacterium TaxID=2636767 RepID=UPI0012DCC5AA|nr:MULTISPECIES: alpha-ketoacid dehydrogenase subunit beta [unclassified Mycolicibacterium]MUL48679.1 alpha-ketoacid dehydrogenase subunit beta [Mycolicibacterium sp. CBMA 360]MUL60823.1 alpha-ketoacid dehydrogenase subunit beta [Mycolicibacterium sp. CBMA 335]MUL71836.1 alpha-ketoacid dehydrogenase subunit beta [Mycolicibacterium sp. CBMA 311]MUL95764.1 alpha-ketoacid dehydrogenase subunit beta [Mycolicibacterium sp. CBMA 230]MUM06362.1 alpha-ketoacid dehydrogenase subunit beta [Mycolicibacte